MPALYECSLKEFKIGFKILPMSKGVSAGWYVEYDAKKETIKISDSSQQHLRWFSDLKSFKKLKDESTRHQESFQQAYAMLNKLCDQLDHDLSKSAKC